MTFEDLMKDLSAFTDEQRAAIREFVAPSTKISRLQQEAAGKMADVNAAVARARAAVQATLSRLEQGDDTAVVPSWDELVKVFDGR